MKRYRPLITMLLLVVCVLIVPQMALSATYYIDPNSVGGTCNNRGPGTESEPFCSFVKKFWDHVGGAQNVDIGPDDVIIFRQGTYGERLLVKEEADFSGREGHPVIIRPYDDEKVVLDGDLYTFGGSRHAIEMPGVRNYIHIYAKAGGGSIEFHNWTNGLDATGPSGEHIGWEIRDLVGRNFRGRGLMFRGFNNLTLRNIYLSVLTGKSNESVVFGFRDGTRDVYAYDCVAEQANDGRGHDGDADGFWSPGVVGDGIGNGPLYFENCVARFMSEDGFDFKDPATLRGCQSIGNTTCGGKFWNATYDIDGFLALLNGEDGIKLSDTRTGSVLNHITSAFNFEQGLQIRHSGADVEIKNAIFAWNNDGAIRFDSLSGSNTVQLNSHHNLYYQNGAAFLISTSCSGYDYDDIDTFSNDLEAGITCGSGAISGTETSALNQEPAFIKALDAARIESVQISEGPTQNLNQVVVKQGNNYVWPGYSVGTFIELNNDGVLRRVTQVEPATFTLFFEDDPLVANYAGRGGDGDGVRITDWGSTPPADLSYDISIAQGSDALVASDTGDEIGFFGFAGAAADTTPPTISGTPSIGVNGTTVTVNFSEAVITTGYDTGDFNLDCTTAGTDIALSSPSGTGSSRTFTAATTIYPGDTCDMDGFLGTDDIEDGAGNDMGSFSNISVDNGSTQGTNTSNPSGSSGSGSGCYIGTVLE